MIRSMIVRYQCKLVFPSLFICISYMCGKDWEHFSFLDLSTYICHSIVYYHNESEREQPNEILHLRSIGFPFNSLGDKALTLMLLLFLLPRTYTLQRIFDINIHSHALLLHLNGI